MSVQEIIQSLKKLVVVHEDLLHISEEKTEIVKEGSVEKLQAILIKERKSIRVLEQAETKRNKTVKAWSFRKKQPLDDVTISNMLEMVDDEREKQELARLTTVLTKVITNLKQQEQLNQALINQSLRFVHMSLDMMNPSINKINYGNKKEKSGTAQRSLFDSKA
ncbi:flagellar protein FlgN [Virgibacillus ainsalahensis]